MRSRRPGTGHENGNSRKVLAGVLAQVLAKMGVLAGVLGQVLAGRALWENRDKTACKCQEILNPTPLNPTPATCHTRKRQLRCNFWNVALQKLHCNIRFSAVWKSFSPKAALQQAKNCSATLKKLRCRKVALSCRFPADFKLPRLGSHV